jgi:ADP-heptose:LPS heptosyltransferase
MRIIIGLIEHMGDIVACEPVSRYLRAKYPNAHLSWAISPVYRELIDTNPNIDETICLNCVTDWIKLSKHSDYDEIIDLHVNYRICQCCQVPLVKERGNPFVSAFEWFDYGALLEAFSVGAGLPKISAQPLLYLGNEHARAVDALELPDNYCVIHRESNDRVKDWTDAKWQFLAKWIRNELNLAIVEVGAGKDIDQSPLNGLAINLINRLSILQTAEVIKRARFFIGIDSGPAHLANATKVPGIILLGRISVFRKYTPYTGYYASNIPEVKLVRNLTGIVAEIPLSDVIQATRYVNSLTQFPRAIIKKETVSVMTLNANETQHSKTDRELLLNSKLFDPAWYSLHYPQVSESGQDPLDHFLLYGGLQGFSPSPAFDASNYLRKYLDINRKGINPLLHYLKCGKSEGREAVPGFSERIIPESIDISVTHRSPFHQPSGSANLTLDIEPPENKNIPRVFAFYLSQFHPISENNFGHRMGFTEWNNVIDSKPLFKGHYQPRIPGELGYYDLRSIEVMEEQVRLAIEHGISGFCFYYYYFAGKKLLYRPIENYIKSDIKAPFFFLWANENWSRRWDGGDHEVIISQAHSKEDDLIFIKDLVNTFQDDRYVKVNGKPILMVYKAHLFQDILSTTELWRNEIIKYGFPDLYLVMVDDWIEDLPHPRTFGFDATYEIPSNKIPQCVLYDEKDNLDLPNDFSGKIVDYHKFAHLHMGRPFPEYKRFRTVMLPWDNTPRYAKRAIIHVNTGSDVYRTWLTQALIDTHNRYESEERIVCLHSWNEWCEGTYLEPDGRLGRRYLEETLGAVSDAKAIIAMNAQHESAFIRMYQLARQKEVGTFLNFKALRTQMYSIQRDLDQKNEDLDQKNSELIAIYRSRSWRISAPLRWFAKLLRMH